MVVQTTSRAMPLRCMKVLSVRIVHPEAKFTYLYVHFTCFGIKMSSKTKLREQNMLYASSGIGITPKSTFRESNMHFMSSEIGMTLYEKFEED